MVCKELVLTQENEVSFIYLQDIVYSLPLQNPLLTLRIYSDLYGDRKV